MADLHDVADRIAAVPGVVAVVLGGSRARNAHTPDSDTDVGVYYADDTAAPLDVDAFRAAIFELDPHPRAITGLYEWGPWVNGGAWTTIDGLGDVDFVYRSLDHVDRTIGDLERGVRQHHWNQQPPFGFTSVIYGGEVHWCVPLAGDGAGAGTGLQRLKQRVATYPEPLRHNVVQQDLWLADFSVANARKPAYRHDIPTTMGCLTRAHHYLVQALYALNRTWFVNDKSATADVDGFPLHPLDYGDRVAGILSGAMGLIERVEAMAEVHAEAARLAGDLYTPPW